nr:immunoglobulin heavy chain junction region [Macaca mulatta]
CVSGLKTPFDFW